MLTVPTDSNSEDGHDTQLIVENSCALPELGDPGNWLFPRSVRGNLASPAPEACGDARSNGRVRVNND